MELIHLLYVSLLRGADESVLPDILESARRHNQTQGVTGMLLYRHRHFLQVLEGPASAVRETFGRILQDDRHHYIVRIDELRVEHRHFGTWSMGFQALLGPELAGHPDVAALFEASADEIAQRVHRGTARAVLQAFHSGSLSLR